LNYDVEIEAKSTIKEVTAGKIVDLPQLFYAVFSRETANGQNR